MTKKKLKKLIEDKSGECRALAMSLRSDADNLSWVHRAVKKMVDDWADQLDIIANDLTEAVNKNDHAALRVLLGGAGLIASTVVVSTAEDATHYGFDQILPPHTVECAREVQNELDKLDALIVAVQRDAPALDDASVEEMNHRESNADAERDDTGTADEHLFDRERPDRVVPDGDGLNDRTLHENYGYDTVEEQRANDL